MDEAGKSSKELISIFYDLGEDQKSVFGETLRVMGQAFGQAPLEPRLEASVAVTQPSCYSQSHCWCFRQNAKPSV